MQRRAIVTVLDAHCQDLDVTSLNSDLKTMGILTTEQCQKLASLDDKAKRHETLLYTLLAHGGPDTYDKLVECMGSRDSDVAVDLQGVLDQVGVVWFEIASAHYQMIAYYTSPMQPPLRI